MWSYRGCEGPRCPRAQAGSSRKGDLDGQEDMKTSGGGNSIGRSGEQLGLEGGGVEDELRRRESVCTFWTLLDSREIQEDPCPKEVSL